MDLQLGDRVKSSVHTGIEYIVVGLYDDPDEPMVKLMVAPEYATETKVEFGWQLLRLDEYYVEPEFLVKVE